MGLWDNEFRRKEGWIGSMDIHPSSFFALPCSPNYGLTNSPQIFKGNPLKAMAYHHGMFFEVDGTTEMASV